jgi:hypothetical protein
MRMIATSAKSKIAFRRADALIAGTPFFQRRLIDRPGRWKAAGAIFKSKIQLLSKVQTPGRQPKQR